MTLMQTFSNLIREPMTSVNKTIGAQRMREHQQSAPRIILSVFGKCFSVHYVMLSNCEFKNEISFQIFIEKFSAVCLKQP